VRSTAGSSGHRTAPEGPWCAPRLSVRRRLPIRTHSRSEWAHVGLNVPQVQSEYANTFHQGATMPHVRVVLTHLNVEKTTDRNLHGGQDELTCLISSGEGINRRRLGEVNIGSFGRTGSARPLNVLLFDDRLDLLPYIHFEFLDRDDDNNDDEIGALYVGLRKGVEPPTYGKLTAGRLTRAFGETIPGSQDFQMTGSGARQSYWLALSFTE